MRPMNSSEINTGAWHISHVVDSKVRSCGAWASSLGAEDATLLSHRVHQPMPLCLLFQLVVLRDPNEEADDILRAHRSRERQFAFDHAFGAQSTQEDVYRATARGLIEGVLRGINSTVFAYGPTGAGKTFTMLGSGQEAGIMCLTLGDLYRQIDRTAEEMRYSVRISYLEV